MEIDWGRNYGEELRKVSGLAVALALEIDGHLGIKGQAAISLDLHDWREVDDLEAYCTVLSPGEPMP